jgi:hypothetical protein
MLRKEENLKQVEREKIIINDAIKKELKAIGGKGKDGQLPKNLTFNDKGQPISQHEVNTDKLPNIGGEFPKIK